MANPILTVFDAATSPFERAVTRVDQRLERFNGDVARRLDRFDNRFERSAIAIRRVGTVVAAVLGAGAVREITSFADAWTQVENRLRSVGVTAEAQRAALVDLSNETRSSLTSNAETVARLIKSTGADYETTLRRVRTLNQLLAAGGSTGAERSSVLLQLSQAIQSGTLQGDELRSLREAAPAELLQAIADAAGAPIGALKDLGAEGALTSDLVLEALDNMAERSDVAFSSVQGSVSDAITVFRNGATAFVGNIDEASGATDRLADVIAGAGSFLSDSDDIARTFGESLGLVAGGAVALAGGRGLGAAVASLQRYRDGSREAVLQARSQVQQTASTMRAIQEEVRQREVMLRVVELEGKGQRAAASARQRYERAIREQGVAADSYIRSVDALNRAQQNATFTARALNGVMGVARGLWAAIGGPAGALLLAVSALVAFSGSAKTAAERVRELEQATSEVAQAESELADVAERLARDRDALSQASERYRAALREEAREAQATAAAEVEAINARIAGNERLFASRKAEAVERVEDLREPLAEATRDLILVALSGAVEGGSISDRMQQAFEMAQTEDGKRLIRERVRIAQERAGTDADTRADVRIREYENVAIAAENALRAAEESLERIDNSEFGRAPEYRPGLPGAPGTPEQLATSGGSADVVRRREELIAEQALTLDRLRTDLEIERARTASSGADAIEVPVSEIERRAAEIAIERAREDAAIRAADFPVPQRDALVDTAGRIEEARQLIDLEQERRRIARLTATEAERDRKAKEEAERQAAAAEERRRTAAANEDRRQLDLLAQEKERLRRKEEDLALADRRLELTGRVDLQRTEIEQQERMLQIARARADALERAARYGFDPARAEAYAAVVGQIAEIEGVIADRAEEAAVAIRRAESDRRQHEADRRRDEDRERRSEEERQRRMDDIVRGARDLGRELATASDIGDVLKRRIFDMAEKLFELAASRVLEEVFGPASGGISGGGAGGGILGTVFASLPSLFGFADGGVMGDRGPLPLRRYARGGIAHSPQLALFGEGSGAEAFVPLPDGRSIPVRLEMPRLPQMPMAGSGAGVVIHGGDVIVQGDASGSTVAELRRELRESERRLRAEIPAAIARRNRNDPNFLGT